MQIRRSKTSLVLSYKEKFAAYNHSVHRLQVFKYELMQNALTLLALKSRAARIVYVIQNQGKLGTISLIIDSFT